MGERRESLKSPRARRCQTVASPLTPMKVAVVGGGITGLSAAWLMSQDGTHEVTLYEAHEYLGRRCLLTR